MCEVRGPVNTANEMEQKKKKKVHNNLASAVATTRTIQLFTRYYRRFFQRTIS